jgi:hypothetical protein
LRSGSKKSRDRPRELATWQHLALERIAASRIGRELVFGGGAALSALYLHHRISEDLDFFIDRELEPGEAASLAGCLRRPTISTQLEVIGPRTSVILTRRSGYVGRVDFAFYPFEPVGRRTLWQGLTVESVEDMTVNKLQAVLTRNQSRDFVDLYFLLREGPLRDLRGLLELVRAKFDVGPHRLGLAARLLLAREIKELPKMIRRVRLSEMKTFFEDLARGLARSESKAGD